MRHRIVGTALRVELSGDHRALQDAVREFAQSRVKPRAEEVDRRHRFPREVIKAAGELDLMGVLIPAEYGGAGLDHQSFTIVVEELARACASTAVIVDVHNSVACEPILLFGTEAQKQAWPPSLSAGEALCAFALTELEPVSGAAALKAA